MLRSLLLAGVLAVAVCPTSVTASDVLANGPLTNLRQADTVCPETCKAYDCAWSGEWRPAYDGSKAVCDCGIERTRYVPGGYTPTQEQAEQVCNQTCGLNGDKWGGTVSGAPGGYDMCGCVYVSDYCPTEQ